MGCNCGGDELLVKKNEAFQKRAFLRLEDLGRSSEAGWRKTSQPVSPQIEVPGWDEPMAVNEREATRGTSCNDLGGMVPPKADLK